MNVFKDAVARELPWLSAIGADPDGGITRLLYSPAWLETQRELRKQMAQSGFETYFDAVGNLFGRVVGSRYPDEVVLSGSHIDTVVYGGNLDGQFGALAAWIAIRWLNETYGAPLRTLEVVSLAEEEGSRFPYVFWGSKNILGHANPDDVREICDAQGIRFVDAMRECGFTLPNAPLKPRNDIKAFVELHIEQGRVLETNQQSIGVVTAIVGQRRYTVTLSGESNHAGSTPMSYRRDTVQAFSRICVESIGKARLAGDPLVLTFGKVEPQPNTVNVVPGKTVFTIDCRHTDGRQLIAFTGQLERDMQAICHEMNIEIDIDLWMDEAPIPMNAGLVSKLERVCRQQDICYRLMHSGAGHDAQIFAEAVPTCMIFMPSIKGISHNPAEATDINDLALGVKTLAMMLYELAYKPEE
ncbi:allantoate deiminase [Atlantibacter subterraneus]|uniref:allantoate deiminase n=1 Tax=Atlantibacter subterraneus TaxID=255519 RepID=UPI002FDEDA37